MVKKMQVPVLFLPKGSNGQKNTLANPEFIVQNKKKKVKIAALLKGKKDGHQKNNNEINRESSRGRKTKNK